MDNLDEMAPAEVQGHIAQPRRIQVMNADEYLGCDLHRNCHRPGAYDYLNSPSLFSGTRTLPKKNETQVKPALLG